MKARDIPGFVLNKITSHLDSIFFEPENKYLSTDELQRVFGEGFNKGVKKQGEREITLNLNKLIMIIWEKERQFHGWTCSIHNLFSDNPDKIRVIELAHAILAAEADILESKKGD